MNTAKAPLSILVIPILGWIYLLIGWVFPFTAQLLQLLWWVDLFLLVVVHSLQIPFALKAGLPMGISKATIVSKTLIFGLTYWLFLSRSTAANCQPNHGEPNNMSIDK